VKPVRVTPDVDVAAMGNCPEQRGFTGSVFPYKKSDGRFETKASCPSKDLLVEGVIVPCGVFFGVKYYFLEMHEKIP
jgi:hypothetical protein